MNSLCQWQSVQQSVFKNSLPCIMHLACQQTCWWQHTYTRTHTSWRKEPSLCSEFFFGEQTCNNGAGIQLFVARWVPTPLSQGWLPKMLLHSHHESLKSYTELLSFFFPFLFFGGGVMILSFPSHSALESLFQSQHKNKIYPTQSHVI